MKKVISLLLVLGLCLSLCACGADPAEVRSVLVKGKWSGYLPFTSNFFGEKYYAYFDFHENGTVDYSLMCGDELSEIANGVTYQIKDGEISFTYKVRGKETTERIEYEYKGGELKLTYMDGANKVFLEQE